MANFIDDVDMTETMDYSKDKSFSYNQIIMMQVKRISEIGSQELTPARMENRPIKVGESIHIVTTYKPDLRISYCNAINMLSDLTTPFLEPKDIEILETQFKKDLEGNYKIEDNIKDKRRLLRLIVKMLSESKLLETTDSREV